MGEIILSDHIIAVYEAFPDRSDAIFIQYSEKTFRNYRII